MMKITKLLKPFVCMAVCTAIIFSAVSPFSVRSKAKTLSSLKSEYSQIQDKIDESEKKVSQLESQKAEQEKIVAELNDQINDLNNQLENVTSQKGIISDDISSLQSKIGSLNDEIADLDKQIKIKDAEIEETRELFCDRMRANYVAGETSILDIITESSDLSSFLNRLEMFKRVTESDQTLVNKMNEEIDSIKEMQNELRDKKASLQQQKDELETRRTDLQNAEDELTETQQAILDKSNEVNRKLNSINYQTQELKVSIEQYDAEMESINNEIKQFLQSQESKPQSSGSSSGSSSSGGSSYVPPSSSGWVWPIPYSSSYISSTYGYRSDPATGSYKFHSGLDITMGGAYGKNIVATKGGTVIRAVYGSTGYGIYVMIDHGNGYSSLYGHCSALKVSVGQHVSAGQVIANIGSSGYSTGPHCHFEIRYNGSTVNPLNYVSRP